MKKFIIMLLALPLCLAVNAQAFQVPMDSWSFKKETTIIKTDGRKVKGQVKNLKRKKGLVKAVVIKTSEGKIEIPADEIGSMYLPPNKFEKMAISTNLNTAIKSSKGEIDDSILEGGNTYWEQQVIELKKGDKTVLMQLLNPSFSKDISVYYDPFAGETTSVGIGGITLAGGEDKSYYVKVEGKKAFKLKKKNYDEFVEEYFKGCDVVEKVGSKGLNWNEFAKHIYAYSTECAE